MGSLTRALLTLSIIGFTWSHDAAKVEARTRQDAAIAKPLMGLSKLDAEDSVARAAVPLVAPDPIGPPENVFQVHEPVLKPNTSNQASCQILLMRHDFANSYGNQFVGKVMNWQTTRKLLSC
jgi:hypothetical protein